MRIQLDKTKACRDKESSVLVLRLELDAPHQRRGGRRGLDDADSGKNSSLSFES